MKQIGITENTDAAYSIDWNRWALEKREPTVLITKNIKKLLEDYPGIENQSNIIFHATITGYGGSFIEPGIPKPTETLATLKDIKLKDRIVVRIDPIIPVQESIERSIQVFTIAKDMGYERFRISCLDLYPHVLKRLEKYTLLHYDLKTIYDWDMAHSGGEHQAYMVHANYVLRKRIFDAFPGADLCGEPGFKCSGCVSRTDLELFGIEPEARYVKNDQREFCNCLGIKKELCHSHDCPGKCIYCYWIKPEDKVTNYYE
jgi:DNA repair photolyase